MLRFNNSISPIEQVSAPKYQVLKTQILFCVIYPRYQYSFFYCITQKDQFFPGLFKKNCNDLLLRVISALRGVFTSLMPGVKQYPVKENGTWYGSFYQGCF